MPRAELGIRARVRRRPSVERLLSVAGALLALVAVLLFVRGGAGVDGADGHRWTLAAYFAAIVAGQVFSVDLTGEREIAPMAKAASLGLAMTYDPTTGQTVFPAPLVLSLTATALLAGLLVRALSHRPVRLSAAAIRLIGVAFATLVFGHVPFLQGRTLLAVVADVPWLVALAMVVCSMLGLALEAALQAQVRSSRTGVPLRVSVPDEVKAAAGLSTAMSAAGALVAMAEPYLHALAVPLFLLPLVMTQFALLRQATIRRTYRQTIRSLSRLPELGGFTAQGHADRVAALSTAVGTELGIPERELQDLEFAALLHDIGQVSLRVPIPGGATVLADLDNQRRIARGGAEIVRQSGASELVARVVETQTTPYRQVREFGEQLPIGSRIIKVVNAYDDLVGTTRHRDPRAAAIERIQLGLGYEYDPQVVEALTRVVDGADRTATTNRTGSTKPGRGH